MVRVLKNVARIACLHVLHSAVPTTAKSNFGTAKSSFSTSCGLSFLVSILRNRPSTHVARFIQTWRSKSAVSLSFNIKRAVLCNRDQCDQQRSINLFHWCIFESRARPIFLAPVPISPGLGLPFEKGRAWVKFWFGRDKIWYGKAIYTTKFTRAEPFFWDAYHFYPSRTKNFP